MLLQEEQNQMVISSDRVDGTAVYGIDKDKIGKVDKLLIDKRGGNVTDVIISAGGFLGIGDEKHSIPWSKLDYDTDLGGYRIDVTKEQLMDAPRFGGDEPDRAYDRNYQTSVYEYWTVAPYW
ncbi:MAG: PRC-barrel domain containing protein [Sphingomonadales bacterium]|nr:PRC-barrel domain containing protein [Sphingomonadales bacterium]PIX67503.1 MAG: photosystem reaction center subunit H [Sphingomonadales bacterium CG_4_10_14_3_um_filter_58_15]NCO49584.1 PRC-barrel domain containing protein [Sphingomonadales bacterium]NCP00300.1 PRC-barrel domain containing protein [Sphingomonadales bacterium]NCP25701.1 PRC-barrel domain containing protein [Sphingomonadales bacterium]